MALDATVLGAAIVTAMTANGLLPGAQTTALGNAIATAVVAHIKSAGVVAGTGLVAPAGGGPVTGAAQIT